MGRQRAFIVMPSHLHSRLLSHVRQLVAIRSGRHPVEICIAQGVIEAGDDRGRRAGRHEHAEPRLDDQSFDAGLLKGRYLRQARRAPLLRRKRPHDAESAGRARV
jgi:hypothetical protein